MAPAGEATGQPAGRTDAGAGVLVTWCRLGPADVARKVARATLLTQARHLIDRPADVASAQSLCAWCGSTEHGPPMLLDRTGAVVALHASTSQAKDLVVVAVSKVGAVGVDVELVDAAGFEEFPLVAAHPEEPPLSLADVRGRTRIWVRKESLLKATGRGLRVDPRLVRVTGPEQPPELISWDADDPPTASVWMEDLHLTDRYAAAVTVLAGARPRVSVIEEARAAPRTTTSR
jgi:4'-phosphopantetheinyl transferase